MFSIFKKSNPQDTQMTKAAVLELADKWWEKGYQKFYFELRSYHHNHGNTSQYRATDEKIKFIDTLLESSLKAISEGYGLNNKKMQEMVYIRVSTALKNLEDAKKLAVENNLPILSHLK
jgi:hypothetical protein